jgi:hypothetical protein
MSLLAIRREVIDYGAIPLSSWLYHGDSPAAIQTLLLQLLEAGQEEGSRCECSGQSQQQAHMELCCEPSFPIFSYYASFACMPSGLEAKWSCSVPLVPGSAHQECR